MRPDRGDLGTRGRRRLITALLAGAMAVAILPLISLGVLAPVIIDDLEISRADLGLLVSVASGISALVSPAAGHIVDRIGDRRAVLCVFIAGALSLTVMAAALSYAAMALALALAGLCHSASNPATNRLISGRVPEGRHGLITGIKQSGETIAIIFAAGTLPAIAVLLGWRAAVALLAGLALAALVTAGASIHGSAGGSSGAETDHPVARIRPSIYWLGAYSFAMGAAGGAVTTYLPLYAHDIGGLSVAVAGSVMVAAGIVATICRVFATPWAETHLGAPLALLVCAVLAVLAGALLIGAPSLGAGAFWVAAALWGASGLAFGSVGMLAVMRESENSNTGRASGLVVFGFGIGLTVTPPVFGWLVDHGYGYDAGLAMVTGFYALAVTLIVLGRSSFLDADHRALRAPA